MKQPRVLLVDDDDLFRRSLSKELKRSGFLVATAATGEEALSHLTSSPTDVVLLDVRLPDMDGLQILQAIKKLDPMIEVIMLTAYGSVDTAVASLKAGAHHYLVKPAKLDEIDAAILKAHEKRELSLENQALKSRLQRETEGETIIGESPAMRELLALVDRVAPTDQTVLIQGESGTGKELIARRIHRLSRRSQGPLVLVDCASLSKTLLESELFGHEKGAFTGADAAKSGLVEAAENGTLFIDEVEALASDIQASFLRLLETREYRRVGSTQVRKADVRIVAAGNTDLADEVRRGNFREDLFFRLSVIVLYLPRLRDRKNDIPLLAEHFLKNASFGSETKVLSPAAIADLQEHDWPGNVRELKNTLERASLLCDHSQIEPWDLRFLFSPANRIARRLIRDDELISLRRMQDRYIHFVLERVHGNQTEAAEILGIDPKTIYRHLKKGAD